MNEFSPLQVYSASYLAGDRTVTGDRTGSPYHPGRGAAPRRDRHRARRAVASGLHRLASHLDG
jgi:hypothetical protein